MQRTASINIKCKFNEGVSNEILSYFDYLFGGQYKLGGLGGTRGGLNPQPPTNRCTEKIATDVKPEKNEI